MSLPAKFIEGELPLIKNRETRYVQINDLHFPDSIDIRPIFDFIKNFKPDYVLEVGDIIQNTPFSHWERAVPGQFKQLPDPQEYYQECIDGYYKPMREAAGDAKRVH